ncbi:hypothetical protein CRENBAI_014089 [Crenichthys baileyi]|uniref:Uncharacterized protein n=1 Tax=Crenichthys baileyi TaxID=28760 RepID=A0AAV9RJQ6_9TELE
MSDYESDDLTGSAPYFMAYPPPTSANRRSTRLASCPTLPSPSSQLRASGIIPGSDVEPSHLVQLVKLLPHHDLPFSPPPPPVSSGKHLRKSVNPPAKHPRGCPAPPDSSPAPPIEPPSAHASTSSAPVIPPAFIASMDSLQCSISSLMHHLQNFTTSTATSLGPTFLCMPMSQLVSAVRFFRVNSST